MDVVLRASLSLICPKCNIQQEAALYSQPPQFHPAKINQIRFARRTISRVQVGRYKICALHFNVKRIHEFIYVFELYTVYISLVTQWLNTWINKNKNCDKTPQAYKRPHTFF